MATAAYIRNFLSAKLLFHGVLLVNDCLIPECSCRARSFQLAFSVCWMRWQRAQDNPVTQWHPKGLPELSCNHTIDLSLRLSLPAIINLRYLVVVLDTLPRCHGDNTSLFLLCVYQKAGHWRVLCAHSRRRRMAFLTIQHKLYVMNKSLCCCAAVGDSTARTSALCFFMNALGSPEYRSSTVT